MRSREVCCLPGVKIQARTEKLILLIKQTDHYHFLLFQIGINDTTRRGLERIERDFEDLGEGKRV